jgi:hypothetical protein
MWLSFIVVVLLGITLYIDAISVAAIVAVLVIRIILVFAHTYCYSICTFRCCCFQRIACLFEPCL